jgi:PBS lyase HEAT-like repeat
MTGCLSPNPRRSRSRRQITYQSTVLMCGIASGIFLAATFPHYPGRTPTVGHGQNDKEAKALVMQLWSEDDVERNVAKVQLLKLGPGAVPPLIALLRDLLRNPGPRYVPGKEREGQEEADRFFELPPTERSEAARRLIRLSIDWRLKADVYELLGKLRAEEATPLLIEAMEREERHSLIAGMSPVMRSLAAIGSAAVPALIASLENAETTAGSLSGIWDSSISPEVVGRSLEDDANRIRVRAILVLEAIGDSRAIPALENIHERTTNEFIARIAKEAVDKIRRKAS